jgi:hypothetical protein
LPFDEDVEDYVEAVLAEKWKMNQSEKASKNTEKHRLSLRDEKRNNKS